MAERTRPARAGVPARDLGLTFPYYPCTSSLEEVAERTRLELATPGVTGRYSNQLNYRSTVLVGVNGIEPLTLAL